MISIISYHLLAVFLFLIIWAIDAFLFLTAMRFVLAKREGSGVARYGPLLTQLTDPARDAVQRWLAAHSFRPLPWLPWTVLVALLLVIEAILMKILLSMG
jgi:hypothetical protein